MVIGIDGNEANIKNRVGVNEYAYQLILNLKKLLEKDGGQDCLIVYLQNNPLSDMPEESKNFKYKVLPGGRLWVITKLMPNIFTDKNRPDIFFSPNHYTLPFSPIPRVCTIHDLGYLENSEHFEKIVFWQLKVWSAISIFVSKYIISVSNRTSQDIVRHYKNTKEKVRVVYSGYDNNRFNNRITESNVRRVKNKYSIVGDYVLFVGTLKPSKNVEGLIEAFSKITDQYKTLKLVIVGKKGWLYETIFNKAKELKIEKRIIFTGFVDEADKPTLFKGAKVFCLPSFWEGFGLDALYSLAVGTPLVVSKVGSIPEVVGEAGYYVNPNNIDSIANGIAKVLSLPKSGYNKLISLGLAQAGKFSWEKCARETLAVIKNDKR